MHIVVVSDYAFVSGGQAKVAIDSAVGLARKGYRVTFFAAVGPVCEKLIDAGIRVVCLNSHTILKDPHPLRGALRSLWNTSAATALSKLLEEKGNDVSLIHVHGWNQALSPSIGPVIVKSGIPHVYSMHEYFLQCPNGALFDYVREENCTLKPMSAACVTRNCDKRNYAYKLYRVVRHAGLNYISKMPTMFMNFIFLSQLQSDVLRRFERPDARYYHVPNPVTVERRDPVPVEENSDYLFIGRLSREKGAEVFAQAARLAGVSAVFVGEGPSRANLNEIGADFEITGWLSTENVLARLRGARAVVFSSIWYETFGLSVYEALACGVPVIVSEGCAATEAVTDGETGLVFKRGDVRALAEAISRLRNPELAQRLGREAYRCYWASPLTLEDHIAKLDHVYEQIVRKSGEFIRNVAGEIR